MKGSICAYKRGEPQFTSYHWCNECPPLAEYRAMERQQKLDWANANKARKQAWENKNTKTVERTKKRKELGYID
jgi:hypothetical protein